MGSNEIISIFSEYFPVNEIHPYDIQQLHVRLEDIIDEICNDAVEEAASISYDDGKEDGWSSGYSEGYEAGSQDGYDNARSDVLTALNA